MSIMRDWTGVKIGMLTGIFRVRSSFSKGSYRQIWRWRCDCGTEIDRASVNVKSSSNYGSVPNCGCRTKESRIKNGKNNTTHGLSKGVNKNLYHIYCQMIRRCTNKTSKDFHLYGGRGINVCQEWMNIKKFFEWALSSGYKNGLTIERINNNANYSPKNCKFIPNEMQAKNTRRIRWITAGGKKQSVSDWSRETGIKNNTIISRLNRGWTGDRAVAR